ncbi:MAG: hypothetical protein U0S48_14350 [Solirubrobacteraceae bacterium]
MRRVVLALVVLATLVVAGCGAGGDSTEPPPTPQPPARAEDFPSAKGKTLMTLREGLQKGPILAPTTAASLYVGDNRVAFALRDRANKLLSGAAVALYTTDHDGGNVRGPYLAHTESLEVKSPFRAQNAESGAPKSIYVAEVPIPKAGRRVITGVARLDGRLVATTGFELTIPRKDQKGLPPDVGDKAIDVHTATIASVGGDAAKISTRVPPAEPMLQTDFHDALGKKPIVLVFATPQLCQSRICGPVVDVAMQVQSDFGDKAAFIQQEIYNNNKVSDGFRPQVEAWRLPTEPWIFVIDRDGRISDRFEGAVSVGELERAVAKVTKAPPSKDT